MDEKIITIASVEDEYDGYDGKEYKRVIDTNGNRYRIKQGKEGSLKAKWDILRRGAAIKLKFGEFKGKSFVKDIELVKEASEGTTLGENPNLLSKEFNTLIMTVKDLWIAGKLIDEDLEVKSLRKLICTRLAIPSPSEEETPDLPNPTVAGADKVNAIKDPSLRDPYSLKNIGELFMAIYQDFGITKTQALKAWEYKTQEEIKDIPGCYQFIASIEKTKREK